MAVQRITRDGHTYRYVGTEAQAEAYVKLQGMHDTDPRHAELVAALHGETPSQTFTPDQMSAAAKTVATIAGPHFTGPITPEMADTIGMLLAWDGLDWFEEEVLRLATGGTLPLNEGEAGALHRMMMRLPCDDNEEQR